ncbi:GNAT family N-acetyltransferase [Massilia sp. YIM B02769]|uniref:GNAT family N-acetyltransferase n=1 Tax=Massilia sp. YIM B02769 TaxID=3050129 RepID=UPI0025B6F61C|nr:GNAT family N-acetyltransferase [Massilia sp. YIM B02769]MDN4061195.1 GNAT family N-acetyltransferase [Massilia sp. YIM B02769]
MLIRPLVDTDLPGAARLLRAAASEFIVHESTPEGASTFLRENDEDGLRNYVRSGHVYHVAEIDGTLAGFIGIRANNHLFHLFVDKRWHGQGLARRLWQVARRAAIERGGDGAFLVNASNHAAPVYEAFGFVRMAPTQCLKGLYFNPMRYTPA